MKGRAVTHSPGRATAERYAAELLELFYPIHYRGTMAIEDAMRGDLTRKQAAILWLIRSAGAGRGYSLRRKEIVARLQDWFEITSPAVTKTLRSLARPPLGLVRQIEDPESGREKRVLLTPKGVRFLTTMADRGRDFLRQVTEQFSEDQLHAGVTFLNAGIAAFEGIHARAGGVNMHPIRRRRTVSDQLRTKRQNSESGEPHERAPIALGEAQ